MDAYNFTDLCSEPTFGQIGVSRYHFPLKEKLRLLGQMANSGAEAGKEQMSLGQIVGKCSNQDGACHSLDRTPTGQRWDNLSTKKDCTFNMLKSIKSQPCF